MRYVLALDQGTTSSRAIVFDRRARIAAIARQEFRQVFPQPGWVEHDPLEIWRSQRDVMAEALRLAGAAPGDITAVGVTNQRETTLLWDRATGEPVANAIVWQDRRTADACDRLKADGLEDAFRHKTGLVLDPYFSGTKLAWLLDHVAGARDRAERGELAFGTVDTWLAYQLTGKRLHVTDASNASRTLLFNLRTSDWDDELLAHLRIPRAVLPELRSSADPYAAIAPGMPAEGAPLAALVGDQQAATMGQLCTQPGLAKNTYGTGCFLLMHTGDTPPVSENKLLSTVAWKRDGKTEYALEGSVFVGGSVVQWLRDGLKIIDSAPAVEALAASVPDAGGVYLVPAMAGLGAPHWDPYARGAVVGLTRGATDAHLARAALDGIAFQVAEVVQAMEADAQTTIPELRVDGGAAANNLLLQTQADLLQRPVVRPKVLETTALGAAYLAGLAVGYWESIDELAQNFEVDRTFEPVIGSDQAASRMRGWSRAVERAKGWAVETG